MEDERLYYTRRAQEERRAAQSARSEAARLRHLELAALLIAMAPPPQPEGSSSDTIS